MGTRKDRTHVGEWAELVGDDVPECALRERTLESARRDGEREEWPDGLS